MRVLRDIKAEHGDLEICKKTTGANVKMKPIEISCDVIKDTIMHTRYQGEEKRLTVDEQGDCLLVNMIDDIKDISEFKVK